MEETSAAEVIPLAVWTDADMAADLRHAAMASVMHSAVVALAAVASAASHRVAMDLALPSAAVDLVVADLVTQAVDLAAAASVANAMVEA